MLVYDQEVSLEEPAYFVALHFEGDRVVSIHDFLFARYALDGVVIHPLDVILGRHDRRKWKHGLPRV